MQLQLTVSDTRQARSGGPCPLPFNFFVSPLTFRLLYDDAPPDARTHDDLFVQTASHATAGDVEPRVGEGYW